MTPAERFGAQISRLVDAVRPQPAGGMLLACHCAGQGMRDLRRTGVAPTHGPFRDPEALAEGLYWHAFTRGCAGVAAGVPRHRVAAAGPAGYAFDQGRAQPDPLLDGQRDRYYFAVTAVGSQPLRGAIKARLDQLGLPFTLKWVRQRAAYARLDSMVLYCPMRLRGLLHLELPRIARSLTPGMLRPEVPIFTLPLVPGLAMAQGLPDGSSFGMDRCRRIAEALWQAHSAGARDHDSRLAEVVRHFRQHGIPIERPYLGCLAASRHAAA